MNAGIVFKSYLVGLILMQLMLLLADVWLWSQGEPTVSVWLRQNRAWYDWTLAVVIGLNSLLFIHLFIGQPNLNK